MNDKIDLWQLIGLVMATYIIIVVMLIWNRTTYLLRRPTFMLLLLGSLFAFALVVLGTE